LDAAAVCAGGGVMGMRDYQNLKDIIIPEAQEKIMDIFCAAWYDCRNMVHCEDCPDRQMLKEKFSLLECFSLKYSRMLIEAGYAPVVHGHWCWEGKFKACSECGSYVEWDETLGANFWKFCPYCGAKMDGGDQDG
jgi:NADH pyrophosphatase NudC (nudix superfamily)